jgi:solute carrier family 25 (mitochondrial phosphate transporter), member 23/24/25/41
MLRVPTAPLAHRTPHRRLVEASPAVSFKATWQLRLAQTSPTALENAFWIICEAQQPAEQPIQQKPTSAARPFTVAANNEKLTFEIEKPFVKADFPSLYASFALHFLRGLPPPVRRLLAGGVAGAVGKTFTAPLESVKLRVVQNGSLGALEAARLIFARGGFGGFFRGNGLDVARTVPSKAIELAAFDALKPILLSLTHKIGDQRHPIVPDNLAVAAAGALAGVLSTTVVHPLETIRTRLAVTGGASGGAFACFADTVRHEGVGALFRGLDASIIGIVPYAAIRLATYDSLKRAHKRATGREHLEPAAAFAFGAVAGIVSASATFPLEVARRRMMMKGCPYGTLPAAIVGIARNEGLGALFNGIWLMVLKQGPQYALGFATYEQMKRALAM